MGGCRISYVSIQICPATAGPAGTALPAAHLERNAVTIIFDTVQQMRNTLIS